jgi:hypothetical protein
LSLNSWITPHPHNQHVLLVSKFPNLAILVGKIGKNSENSLKNVNKKIIAENLRLKIYFKKLLHYKKSQHF